MALAKPRLLAAYFLTAFLLVCMGVFTVYASDGESIAPVTPGTAIPIYEEIVAINATIDSMIVNASWLDGGEMLRIDVVDINTGTVSSLAVRLSDFVTNADAQNSRYIMIQAVDLDGNLSGVIQISNPFYVPAPIYNPSVGISPPASSIDADDDDDNSDVEPSQQGLTPDGTGTVVDNVVTQNEIEFFTVYTEEGNVFFLVVDRQRNTDNVYLLNAVTKADLMALAEQSGNPIDTDNSISAVPTPPPFEPPADEQEPQPPVSQPEPDVGAETPSARGGNNNWIFIVLIVAAVGGVAYYFKIVKGKKSSAMSDDEDWEDEDAYLDDYLGDGTGEGGDEE